MSRPRNAVFIATKPLQIMFAMLLRRKLRHFERVELYVVGDFYGYRNVAAQIKALCDEWSDVKVYATRREAVFAVKKGCYSNVFIDSDVGVSIFLDLLNLKLINRKITISVYEEGLGTYREDLYPSIKKHLFKLAGIGSFFGGSCLTREVWVCNKGEYINNFPRQIRKVKEMPEHLSQFISGNISLLSRIFGLHREIVERLSEGTAQSCTLYLSGWLISENAVSLVNSVGGLKILKLHPHIKTNDRGLAEKFDIQIEGSVPAEVLVLTLTRIFRVVNVVHHGSSIVRYIRAENIVYRELTASQ